MSGIIGGGDKGAARRAEQNAKGSALSGLLAREAEVNAEMGAEGGSRRRRGRQLLTYLNDEPAKLN